MKPRWIITLMLSALSPVAVAGEEPSSHQDAISPTSAAALENKPADSPATAAETRQIVRDALRNHATAKETDERERATRRLVDVLVALKSDRTLTSEERIALHSQVRARLMTVQRQLRAVLARHAEEAKKRRSAEATSAPQAGTSAKPANVNPKDDALAQILPGSARPRGAPIGGFQTGAQRPVDHGQELVELIQKVVATPTWDVNGGPSSIAYYRNFHALVVRAPAEVHGEVGNVLGQMRK